MLSPTRKAVLALVHEPSDVASAARAAGLGISTVREALQKMLKRGLVESVRSGGWSGPALYVITNQGRQALLDAGDEESGPVRNSRVRPDGAIVAQALRIAPNSVFALGAHS
ncbi:MAG: hypothetical protein EOO27_37870 [Comamonadaceae bacterium]|nr:MAG: hypothetical protein EOO27_37870 [Comamonadaceae bacterium]